MTEFARVLTEIIRQGKRSKRFQIKELAQRADITPSYLSNLKLANRKPPAPETFLKLLDALRDFGADEPEIQGLIDAYNRTQIGGQETGNLLQSLFEQQNVFERLRQSVQQRGLVRQPAPEIREAMTAPVTPAELIKGDRRDLILKGIALLRQARARNAGGKIYLTWFQHGLDDELEPLRGDLRECIRSLLWLDSPFEFYHLWSSVMIKEIEGVVRFLTYYLGATNCFLFEVPDSQRMPEYLLIEQVGFIEARPTADGKYWIRTVLVDEQRPETTKELNALHEYLEFLLGTPTLRQPLVRTEASLRAYTVTPMMQKLAEAETQADRVERLLIKSGFSAIYRNIEHIRQRLRLLKRPPEQIEAYLRNHRERLEALQQVLTQGKSRSIHEKQTILDALHDCLSHTSSEDEEKQAEWRVEAQLLQEQITEVLSVIRRYPQIHFGFSDHALPAQFELAGETAFFAFDPPEANSPFPFLRDELIEIMAWTSHPDVLYRLRKDFDDQWNALDPLWRTDTDAGREQIVTFLVSESLKIMLEADVPAQELWAFLERVLTSAADLDREEFDRAALAHEQAASDILLLSDSFDVMLLPVSVGPWDATSLTRTRQRLLASILNEVERFHVIAAQNGLDRYWETGEYDRFSVDPDQVEQSFRRVHHLLTTSPQTFSMEVLPPPFDFPVSVEIINQEILLFHKAHREPEEGGLMVQDTSLAQAFAAYIERNLSARCPESLHGAQNVAGWLEARFLKATDDPKDAMPGQSVASLLRQARTLLTRRRYEEAIAAYNLAVEQDPGLLETPAGLEFFLDDTWLPLTAAHNKDRDLLPYLLPEYHPATYTLSASASRALFPLILEYAGGKVKGRLSTAGRSLFFTVEEVSQPFEQGVKFVGRILSPTPRLKVWTITPGKPHKLGTIAELFGSSTLTDASRTSLKMLKVFPA